MIDRKAALAYLEDQQKKHALSRVDQAHIVLSLQSVPSAGELCKQLALDFRGLDGWRWMKTASLFEACLVVTALYSYDRTLLDGECIAHIATLLTSHEQAPGGPYVPDKGEPMIEANAAVAQLFALFETPLSNVVTYIKRHAPYAPMIALLLSRPKPIVLFPRLNTSRSPRDMVAALLIEGRAESIDIQKPNGSFYDDPICTALVLESTVEKSTTMSQAKTVLPSFEHIEKQLEQWPDSVRVTAKKLFKTITTSRSSQEIVTIVPLFVAALRTRSSQLTHELCERLSQATAYFWMAAVVFDDILDDEGTPEYLPVASIMQRKSIELFAPMALEGVLAYFDEMDMANAWELAHCRFNVENDQLTLQTLPRFGNCMILARRARGHVIGPLILLEVAGATAIQKRSIRRGFDHYLIARQLSDDMHDWMSDVRKGHVSYVVASLLRALRLPPGVYMTGELIERMALQFFDSGLRQICEKMLWHIAQSRMYFAKSTLLRDEAPFFDLMAQLERIAQQGLQAHKDQIAFTRIYEGQ